MSRFAFAILALLLTPSLALAQGVQTGGSGLGPTQFQEDTAHQSGDKGAQILCVRKDTAAALADTDGDYAPCIVDSTNRIWMRVGTIDGGTITSITNTVTIAGTVQPGNTANTTPWLTKPHDGTNPLLGTAIAPAASLTNKTVGTINTQNLCPDEGTSPLTWSPCVPASVVTREVTIGDADGPQTDASLVGTIATGNRVVVTRLSVTMDASNSGTVGCRIGFGATTLPAASLAGTNGIVLPRTELNAREGIILKSDPVGKGADGEELRATCDDPVGGAIYIGITYYLAGAN